jgi:hypothetical protein
MLESVFISVGFNLIFNVIYFELCFNLNFLGENSLLKIMAYFTLFLSMSILKQQLLKLQHS